MVSGPTCATSSARPDDLDMLVHSNVALNTVNPAAINQPTTLFRLDSPPHMGILWIWASFEASADLPGL